MATTATVRMTTAVIILGILSLEAGAVAAAGRRQCSLSVFWHCSGRISTAAVGELLSLKF